MDSQRRRRFATTLSIRKWSLAKVAFAPHGIIASNPGVLTTLAIANYRSLRNLIVPLQRLNVVTGANGSGKSSLYRAERLLAETAQGRVVQSLAREVGWQSTLWAGPESASLAVRRDDHPLEGTRRGQIASDESSYITGSELFVDGGQCQI